MRVSTAEQGDVGAGLAAQRQAITAACKARGWELARIEEDVASGKSTNGRHGLQRAVEACDRGQVDALVVARLDRLSRSLIDFAGLVERSRGSRTRKGWAIVALDVGLDLTTVTGEMIAGVLASLAQWERRIIGERTKAALAQRKAEGVQLGRPRTIPDDVRARILLERKLGRSFFAISNSLNMDHVPTAQGGRQWHPSTVRQVVLAAQARPA